VIQRIKPLRLIDILDQRTAAWLLVSLLIAAPAAFAQGGPRADGYPSRPVRFIVPLPPGGSPDVIARIIAAGLDWPQPVIVDNRTGGGRNLAAELVAKSAPDGHTWLLTPDNILTANPHLGKTPFDPFRDFTPVTQVARFQFLLVVHPAVPARSVQELVALAKAKPGSLNFGSSGSGSAQHLGTAMLQYLAGIEMTHVPYKGAGPALADLLPGRIQVWIGAANSLLPHIKEGRLRVLASVGARRLALLPDVPTVAESGVAGYRHDVWSCVTMPAKVPPAVVAKVSADIARVLNAPDTKARLGAQGIDVQTGSPQELARLIREDYERWGKVIRATGIKAE
jgi:tripartite-type tricarboxylate transporter receptor subunit TctC